MGTSCIWIASVLDLDQTVTVMRADHWPARSTFVAAQQAVLIRETVLRVLVSVVRTRALR